MNSKSKANPIRQCWKSVSNRAVTYRLETRLSFSGNLWSVWWLTLCPAEMWWPRAAATVWPVHKILHFLFLFVSSQHSWTFPSFLTHGEDGRALKRFSRSLVFHRKRHYNNGHSLQHVSRFINVFFLRLFCLCCSERQATKGPLNLPDSPALCELNHKMKRWGEWKSPLTLTKLFTHWRSFQKSPSINQPVMSH